MNGLASPDRGGWRLAAVDPLARLPRASDSGAMAWRIRRADWLDGNWPNCNLIRLPHSATPLRYHSITCGPQVDYLYFVQSILLRHQTFPLTRPPIGLLPSKTLFRISLLLILLSNEPSFPFPSSSSSATSNTSTSTTLSGHHPFSTLL